MQEKQQNLKKRRATANFVKKPIIVARNQYSALDDATESTIAPPC